VAGTIRACGRALVVDDDRGVRLLVRDSLVAAGFEVTAVADGEDALAAFGAKRPDVVVLDVNLPRLSGYELCRRFKEADSSARVLFLSGERTEWFDRVAGLLLGGDDYAVKPFDPDELVARVRALLAQPPPTVPERMGALTRRELQVLRLLAAGRNQREIADELVISPRTVGTHIEHILEKLGVRSRAQAVALAYREELVSSR
jgi:DNA-binding NarL/FixJ family response regulator